METEYHYERKVPVMLQCEWQDCVSHCIKDEENKLKSSWMLHNINRILGAVHSFARSVHIYQSSECKFAEDCLFNNTGEKMSTLAINKIM
jgi:hypothetical protein